MNKAVIVTVKRTPIGKKAGMLHSFQCEELASRVMKEIVKEMHVDVADIDEIILGNAAGPGGNIARLSSLTAGFPMSIPGVTVDRQCGSGLEAINLAARLIQAGAGEVYLAGGVESPSTEPIRTMPSKDKQEPRILKRARFSPDTIGDPDMGVAAEQVAERYHISRAEQDEFALMSYRRTLKSIEEGRFQDEIVSIPILGEDGLYKQRSTDETPKRETNYERLLKRSRPVFKENGTVTAGNSCAVNDGAAVALIMSEKRAIDMGLMPMLTFIDSVAIGVNPNFLGIAPVPAVKKLLNRNHLSIHDIDLVEFNEAFASQVVASKRELNIPIEKLNVGGGAIAYGHPYGASGAILVSRLAQEMKFSKARHGIATLGIGGGIGLATLFDRYES